MCEGLFCDHRVHPQSRLHYRHVVPSEWGPFVDARATLLALAQRRDLCHSVVTPAEYATERTQDAWWQNERICYVDWSNENLRIGPPLARKCVVALYALEAWNDEPLLLGAHQEHWARMREAAYDYDAVLSYTPKLRDLIRSWGFQTHLYPLGWSPETAGWPRWNAPKFQQYVYWGSHTGARCRLLPELLQKFDGRLHDVSGEFGRSLTGHLDTARGVLHIPHTPDATFAQWRGWQCLASSAGLVAQDTDSWPFVPGEHYLPLSAEAMLDPDKLFWEAFEYMEAPQLLERTARAAFDGLATRFRAERTVEDYLVPASMAMLTRRRTL